MFCGLCTSIFFRILQRYQNSDKKGFKRICFTIIWTTIQVKNILLLVSLIFYSYAFYNYTSSMSMNSNKLYNSSSYYDFYSLASNQKTSRNLEVLSFYALSLYSLKYIQIFNYVNVMFVAFKKSILEYFLLFIIITIVFLGLSLLTYYYYGQHIFGYQSFISSMEMNLKFFLLNENFGLSKSLLSIDKSLAIAICVIFIFAFRYFLLFLFYPILIENYRIQIEQFNSFVNSEQQLSIKKSNNLF